ncbi:uncharacterized protein BYT42DRAFT_568486 [Radiomyces spectabilis]|uniref:uncharacterized protein n=1 Tax=Radiomyces spectabilis TaxID=64574 RepID=UPI00221F3246|nr:uncharacterized protein BYT42DRAFT_568486 [Radiomyces spectabilis]KAI8379344.1 hypothetical protein BYT42DRAFT_568486 [Radiomyces spectabilis]
MTTSETPQQDTTPAIAVPAKLEDTVSASTPAIDSTVQDTDKSATAPQKDAPTNDATADANPVSTAGLPTDDEHQETENQNDTATAAADTAKPASPKKRIFNPFVKPAKKEVAPTNNEEQEPASSSPSSPVESTTTKTADKRKSKGFGSLFNRVKGSSTKTEEPVAAPVSEAPAEPVELPKIEHLSPIETSAVVQGAENEGTAATETAGSEDKQANTDPATVAATEAVAAHTTAHDETVATNTETPVEANQASSQEEASSPASDQPAAKRASLISKFFGGGNKKKEPVEKPTEPKEEPQPEESPNETPVPEQEGTYSIYFTESFMQNKKCCCHWRQTYTYFLLRFMIIVPLISPSSSPHKKKGPFLDRRQKRTVPPPLYSKHTRTQRKRERKHEIQEGKPRKRKECSFLLMLLFYHGYS